MSYIKDTVDCLVAKHRTSDPFELCERLDIRLSFEPLPGAIKGFYYSAVGMEFITVNGTLNPAEKRLVCAHELGHARLHPGVNSLFLKRNTYICESKLENQADLFAVHLLVRDEDLLPDGEEPVTLEQLSARMSLPLEYLRLRYDAPS